MSRLAETLTAVLEESAADDMYGGFYFGQDRPDQDRGGLSGYATYDRKSSNAEKAAYIVWNVFPGARSLDVGCALGFLVEALGEVGFDAYGIDHSDWAVRHAPKAVRRRLRRASLPQALPFGEGEFGLVTVLETLEHLTPESIPEVLRELRRICSGYLYATIPSFGPNRCGPGGWFAGKVRPERLEHYESLGPGYDGPVPFEDLMRDAAGQPIEGHLTIASFNWWEARFAEAGFLRCCEAEQRVHPLLEEVGQAGWWCPYVLRVPGAGPPPPDLRSPQERQALASRWGLEAQPVVDACER